MDLLQELTLISEQKGKAVVKPTGRTFGVFVDGKLTEGGFFGEEAAQKCADEYNLQLDEAQGDLFSKLETGLKNSPEFKKYQDDSTYGADTFEEHPDLPALLLSEVYYEEVDQVTKIIQDVAKKIGATVTVKFEVDPNRIWIWKKSDDKKFRGEVARHFSDEVYEAKEQTGWCLYYDQDTKVGNTMFKKGQVVEGPFPNWTREDMKEQLKEYDAASRKNLTVGNKTVVNGFVKE